MLKLDPNSNSWWKENGPGCKVRKDGNGYEGCLVKYVYVEVFQAGLQCYFAVSKHLKILILFSVQF